MIVVSLIAGFALGSSAALLAIYFGYYAFYVLLFYVAGGIGGVCLAACTLALIRSRGSRAVRFRHPVKVGKLISDQGTTPIE